MRSALLSLFSLLAAGSALASPVEILNVEATETSAGVWRFAVTLNHDDTGWDHYANRWEVWSKDGAVQYGTRVLHHPHVNEMPFTRSASGIKIPTDVETVMIRAFDNLSETEVQGELVLDLP